MTALSHMIDYHSQLPEARASLFVLHDMTRLMGEKKTKVKFVKLYIAEVENSYISNSKKIQSVK